MSGLLQAEQGTYEKSAGILQKEDFIPANRTINYVGCLTFPSTGSAGTFAALNVGASNPSGGSSASGSVQRQRFFVRRKGGMVSMHGILVGVCTLAITGASLTGNLTTGAGGWVNMFSLSNVSGTNATTRSLFPLTESSVAEVVGNGIALINGAPPVGASTANSNPTTVPTAASTTSIFSWPALATPWRVYVSATVAYGQVFVPLSYTIRGLNTTRPHLQPAKVMLGHLEYPCIDPRPQARS